MRYLMIHWIDESVLAASGAATVRISDGEVLVSDGQGGR
jgi:hypothetical protein